MAVNRGMLISAAMDVSLACFKSVTNMTGRLYLHLGPPKTATTAFQYALQDGISDRLVYGGVRQPRSSEKTELSYLLHTLCAGVRKATFAADMQKAQKTIGNTLANGANLLISEEMFLVDSHSSSFQEKIARLEQIVGGFCPTIILCARDPLEGLPSLYQELYRNLPLGQKLSFRRFVRSNQAEVFDYPGLINTLNRAGFQKIQIVAFDRLVNGEVKFSDIFGLDFGLEKKVIVPKTNVGTYAGSKNQRVFKPLELRDVIAFRRIVPRFLRRRLQQNGSILGKYSEKLAELNVTKAGVKHLELAEPVKNRLQNGYLAVLSGDGNTI